ncbi:MarR family winged helix-turn-helix transcriptional regulator [Micromonospora sp. KC213]|uniref:MarR family winged helix-turn-helix transcriptional regulator n=1 Tax=Micromonospora sp. KC213 TaxID=2530378 RepID=UPI001046B1FA|nr:MarR family winged helix-turn-helix transcriptional regulator [Micromonospora sp. KC213]TDC43284.1 MarR family transcriptional regulator [Micromonospora sp. KC213]
MFDEDAPGSDRPLAARANFLLSQLGFHVAQTFAARLAPLGIAPNHFGLLTHLEHGEGSTQQQLADALGIHRKVMVGLLDDLEQRGLAERRRHPGDRRAHAVHLTDAARQLLPRARRVADQHEEEILAALDVGERAWFVAALQRIADRTGNPPGVHPGLGAAIRSGNTTDGA